jgi:hypothetical protein
MKLYRFRTVPLSIIRSLFTVHSAVVYVIQVCRKLSSRSICSCSKAGSICSCSKALYKPVRHIPLLSVQWINSWWWTEKLSETCRVSWQNKFVKLVHLVGFITKKFVTMHGHVNVKNIFKVSSISSCVPDIFCRKLWTALFVRFIITYSRMTVVNQILSNALLEQMKYRNSCLPFSSLSIMFPPDI